MEVAYGLVLLGVISVYLQIILGRICRRSTSWYVHNGARAAYLLSNIVGSVAMGAMHPDRSTVVWILSLVVLNNSLVVYDQENGLQRALTVVNISLVVIHSVRAFNHNSQLSRRSFLYWIELVLIIAFILACALCKFFINEASLSKLYSEAVADYMKSHELGNEVDGYDPSTLRGYRYLVKFKLPPPRTSDPPNPRTTVEDIYRRPENGDPEAYKVPESPEQKRRKELCLSFALFRLLFCCYNHVNPCAQSDAAEQKIRCLLFHWLPVRGFRLVEVELAFLHDHVHSGYVFWSSGLRRCYTGLSFLKAILYIASVVLYSKTTDTAMHVSVLVLVLVLLHLLLDILQIIFYCTSDRWMVSYMCRSCRNDPHSGCLHRVKLCIDRCVAQINTNYNANWFGRDYWQNRIGQYSLLEDPCNQSESNNISISTPLTFFDHTAKEADPVNLPPSLKAIITQTLQNSNGALNGVPSLAPRHVTASVFRRNNKLVIILKWHIATCYCEIAYKLQTQQHQQQDNLTHEDCYKHATILSRYCAYLVAFHPELLTDMVSDAKENFWRVHDEYKRVIGWQPSLESRFGWLELEANSEHPVSIYQTTMIDGLKLGELLRRNIEHVQRWRILEKIWLKLILIIALPSHQSETSYAEHVKCLAKGGELLTHLWSILSHAGILEQQPWPQDHVYVDPDVFTTELQERYGSQ